MIKQIFAFILVLAIPWQLISNAYFTHYHYTPCGHITTHAHPFKKGDNNNSPDHTHDEHEMFFLELMHNSMPLVIAGTVLDKPSNISFADLNNNEHNIPRKKLDDKSIPKRGPPLTLHSFI